MPMVITDPTKIVATRMQPLTTDTHMDTTTVMETTPTATEITSTSTIYRVDSITSTDMVNLRTN